MVYSFLGDLMKKLEIPLDSIPNHELSNTDVLFLPIHKKKSIQMTLRKLPVATAKAYSDTVIKRTFVLNGQLDPKHYTIPSYINLLHTYRGNIQNTCLEDRQRLINELYKEAFINGIVSEQSFDKLYIPSDKDFNGNVVNRDVPIRQENRQRAKCLTCPTQIQERIDALFQIKLDTYKKKKKLYETEKEIYNKNEETEKLLVSIYTTWKNKETNTNNLPTINETIVTSFQYLRGKITYDIIKDSLSKLHNDKLKDFVHTRSERSVSKGGKVTYLNVPNNKKDLVDKLLEMHTTACKDRVHPDEPIEPTL